MEKTPTNILIIRLSAIGDIVMASGLIPALKSKYPNANISWLSEPTGATLLKDHPHLSEIIIWPKQEWLSLYKAKKFGALFRAVKRFRRTLKSKQFDLVLDAQGLLKSAILSRMTSAPRRIGFDSKEGGQYLMHEIINKTQSDMISSEYREMASYLGANEHDFKLQVISSQRDQQSAEYLLNDITSSQKFIVLCPFTTRPQKHWIDSYWKTLCELLIREHDLPCLVLGGKEDTTKAEEIFGNVSKAHVLAGKTNLLQTSHIIAQCSLLVGVDTGITHMGTAHEVPTIALFGSTRPYTKTSSFNTHVIYDNMPCAPCRRRPTCNGHYDCMQAITPERVFSIAKEKLIESSAH